ncbi:MAG: protein-glutamate O-methyltransferase CheR [Polyangiaceae bacterium]
MPDATLTPSLFAILTGLIEGRTGMHYELRDNELFSSKVLARASEAGYASALDYYYFLRYDDHDRREFDALVESLVVNETYFFREIEQLRVLCDDIVRPAVDAGKRMRIWCAASSTGEEPLTLAILLADLGILDRVDIVASDISQKALARAMEGVYGQRSLRSIREHAHSRWLDVDKDRATVRPALRERISWRRINLLDTDAVATLGQFDVVLCRNVLIYFSEDTVRQVTSTLAQAMQDNGVLLVGASESLLRFGTLLQCEERGGSFFYRKST